MSPPAISSRRYLTPAQVAEQLGVKAERVIRWIRSGHLRGVNLGDGLKRPRFKVAPCDLESFLITRAVRAPVKPARRRRADPGVTEFFR